MMFREHDLDWTSEKTERFWNYYHKKAVFDVNYFSRQLGGALIDYVSRKIRLSGKILDYGAGKGYLTRLLLNKMREVYACDFSAKSIEEINSKCANISNFKGSFLLDAVPSAMQSRWFDCVFLVETLEHLTDEYLDKTLNEIRRIMKNNAALIITVPNDEELDFSKVFCPECGAVFHAMQHIKSFDKFKLEQLLIQYGFEKVFCNAVYLERSFIKRVIKIIYRKLRNIKQPYLIYIGRKRE